MGNFRLSEALLNPTFSCEAVKLIYMLHGLLANSDS